MMMRGVWVRTCTYLPVACYQLLSFLNCATHMLAPPVQGIPIMKGRSTPLFDMQSVLQLALASVKITRMSESVLGMIIAPPMPRKTRTAMTISAVSATRTSSEDTRKIV